MKVYIVRHAQSMNQSDNIPLSLDPSLSDTGKQESKILAERLKNYKIDLIISSTSQRARETALIVNEALQKEIHFDDLIKEIKPPRMETKEDQTFFFDVIQNMGKSEDAIKDDRRDETFEELELRSARFLDDLNKVTRNVLVVTHSTFSRVLILQMILGKFIVPEQVKALHMNHTGLTVCERTDNKWKLLTCNDFSHVADLEQHVL